MSAVNLYSPTGQGTAASSQQTPVTSFMNDKITLATHVFINGLVNPGAAQDQALNTFYSVCTDRIQELGFNFQNDSAEIIVLAKLFKKLLKQEIKKRPDSEKIKISAARDEFFTLLMRDLVKGFASDALSITKAGFKRKVVDLNHEFKHIPQKTISDELDNAVRKKFPITGFNLGDVNVCDPCIQFLPAELIAHIFSFLDSEQDICHSELACKRFWNISNLSPQSIHWSVLLKKHFPDISPIYAIPCGIQLKHVMTARQEELAQTQSKVNMEFQSAISKKQDEIGKLSEAEQARKRIEVFGANFDGTNDSIDPNSIMGRTKTLIIENNIVIKTRYNQQRVFNEACKKISFPASRTGISP